MKSIFFFLSFCFLTIQLYAQETIQSDQFEGIELRNTEIRKSRLLPKDRMIRIKTTDGRTIKGCFNIIDDTTIQIEGIPYLLSDIQSIHSTFRTSKIVGGVLIGIGSAGLITGTVLFAQGGFGILFGSIVYVLSAIPTAVGVPLLFIGKEYSINKGWTYHTYTRL